MKMRCCSHHNIYLQLCAFQSMSETCYEPWLGSQVRLDEFRIQVALFACRYTELHELYSLRPIEITHVQDIRYSPNDFVFRITIMDYNYLRYIKIRVFFQVRTHINNIKKKGSSQDPLNIEQPTRSMRNKGHRRNLNDHCSWLKLYVIQSSNLTSRQFTVKSLRN